MKSVASVIWGEPGDQLLAQADVVQSLGYRHLYLQHDQAIPEELDILLIQGPYGPVWPIALQLLERPALRERLSTVYWFQQNLVVGLPPLLERWAPKAVHAAQRASDSNPLLRSLSLVLPSRIRTPGGRVGNLGELLWLHQHELIDVQAVSSSVFQAQLASHGIETLLVPRGYHRLYGAPEQGPRDIDAIWLGRLRSRRRRRALESVREGLRESGLELRVHDGIERPFVYGEERTALLNRSKFCINLHAKDTDEISIRHFIAMANGAVVVTERNRNEYPFEPGEHLIEATAEQMSRVIKANIAREAHMQGLADRAFELISTQLRLIDTVSAMFQRIERPVGGEERTAGVA